MEGYEYHLIDFLHDHGLSQAEVSRRTGIPASTMNRYANGADMPASAAKLIAAAAGTTVDELLGLQPKLTASELEIIACYRDMSPRFQSLLLENARAYRDNGQAKNNQYSEVG